MSADENDPLLQALNADTNNNQDSNNANAGSTTTSAPAEPIDPEEKELYRNSRINY